ncbi:hypothetical protein KOW79_021003 [Hemibagrus wyckioides]|uniref:Uncharacterized protein n=1 Tax=Hemibagrus wyckioides TaxID=337641 RepID=A0A9D3N5K4_9TELE|nr:hypothetical protein KOW79_021003 [Hemibagrus wyckioides]
MFPNDYPELLFLRLMTVFSVWIWRKRSVTRTIGSQSVNDKLPVQSPVSPSAGFSVVVKAESGSIVTLPALINSTFSDHVALDITGSTAFIQAQTEKENLDWFTEVLQKFLASHRAEMKKKCECIFEGKKDTKTKILLKKDGTKQ